MPRVTLHYRDEWSGHFTKAPLPPRAQPRFWHRVVVQLPALCRPRGPWREKPDDAVQDAVTAGLGHYDRIERAYILPVPAEIQTTVSLDPPADE